MVELDNSAKWTILHYCDINFQPEIITTLHCKTYYNIISDFNTTMPLAKLLSVLENIYK